QSRRERSLQQDAVIKHFVSRQRDHFEDGFIEVEPVLARWHLVDEGPDAADDVAGALAVFGDKTEGIANFAEIGRSSAQPAQGSLRVGNPRSDRLVDT